MCTLVGLVALLALSPGQLALSPPRAPDAAVAAAATTVAPCRVEIVDQDGLPAPLVELRTVNNLRFVSDNAGLIALDEPDLFGREVFFHVVGHGHEAPADGFGYRGARFSPSPGATHKVVVKRTSVARRLGRLTGGGLFCQAQKLGAEADWPESGVLGCDSVQCAAHGGRLFWFWGDTNLPEYPLGVFHASGATTPLVPFDLSRGVVRPRYEYFRDERRRPRGVAAMPGEGPTWLSGVVSLPDREGRPRLGAAYVKITPPLEPRVWGLCVWNEAAERFEPLKTLWDKASGAPPPAALPKGHAAFHTDGDGRRWALFGDPFPTLRCPATFEAWQDPATWRKLEPPEKVEAADGAEGERLAIRPHSGSIAWHPWRRHWVTVFLQWFGKPSAFGELWYAEADAPTGPWGPAVKVLSHQNYTFYNPRVHAELFSADAPTLVFEGTHTIQFADHAQPTPRHDYNQILYRLDLDDERLAPARASR